MIIKVLESRSTQSNDNNDSVVSALQEKGNSDLYKDNISATQITQAIQAWIKKSKFPKALLIKNLHSRIELLTEKIDGMDRLIQKSESELKTLEQKKANIEKTVTFRLNRYLEELAPTSSSPSNRFDPSRIRR